MGLFDFIKGDLIEAIDWVEKDQTTVMWKFPGHDHNIKYGAQLTVRESQTALFLDESTVVDLFGPGRFELNTRNMPVLTSLRNWDKGFKSSFKAEVYFLSTRTFANLKWGTPNPVIMRDPQFKEVEIKAFGVYFVKIADPVLFFKEFAGTHDLLKMDHIEEELREIVSPKFAEAIAESGISVKDMVAHLSELGSKVEPVLQKDLDPFGIELVKFQITSASLPKEVEEFYDKMTRMNLVEDMKKSPDFQPANAIEKATEGPGGGTGEGIGMGMGSGMAQMMINQQKNQESGKIQTKEEVLATLKELGNLKEAGILTEDEFQAKKKELLARI